MIPEEMFLHFLKKHFGFNAFRPGQKEALQALFTHRRLLCIQPTGHGKSLLYQFPSCLLEGLTLVISPLLALMRDQMQQLEGRFKIPAASINSDQSEEENAQARRLAQEGKIKVLFVSPEQLDHIDRFDFLLHLSISLIVIDEAHCISTWGHDFRPSYRQILHFTQAYEKIHLGTYILALTATADAHVERDIQQQLTNMHVLRESMDRPNIELSVICANGIAEKLVLCKTLLSMLEGSGLVYCATRENTELVAEYLARENIAIVAYHAGLSSEEKKEIQSAFSQDKYQRIAATTALGMGIDKANLRYIIHFDIPGSITAYYQEVGRCGRDGLKARGILLYDPADRKVQEYFIDSALPSKQDFEQILAVIRSCEEPPNVTKIRRISGLHPTRVLIILAELLEQKHLKRESVKSSQVYTWIENDTPLDLSRYTTQHLVKTQELDRIIAYAQSPEQCRMALLRSALGDVNPPRCGRCDVCRGSAIQTDLSKEDLGRCQEWLKKRTVPIAEARTYRISSGVSLLDGKLRSPLFIRFMKERTVADHLEEELLLQLKEQASLLAKRHHISAVVLLPSNTWKAGQGVAKLLADHLGVKLLHDLLSWETPPEKRQGELLNNDQRQENVQGKMRVNKDVSIAAGGLLLLDDYTGCGATLKEAARALRKVTDGSLVPLTIATVKWRLGKPGFV